MIETRWVTLLALGGSLLAQTVTRLELKVEPGAKLRPMDTAVIQVKVYGEAQVSGATKSGRLRRGDWKASVVPSDGGWLTKPFRYQGTDTESYIDTAGSAIANIFTAVASNYVVKDSVTYMAPEKPGTYRVEVALGTVRESIEITVDSGAPEAPGAKTERVTFAAEVPSTDPYRKLVEHWAPHVAQETWFDWRADALRRFDYDGDWEGNNNWENLLDGSSQAYVYYAVIESETHWFLIYNFFHARDYSDNCIAGTCHENDNEGIVMTVRKGNGEFGQLEALESLAHNNVYSYTADNRIRNGAHSIEGKIVLHDGSHPVVFLEAGGHGALGGGDKKSFYDGEQDRWRQGTGITYSYQGHADRPRFGMDRDVGYELLPIYDHWWTRAQDRKGKAFSAFYRYQPFGGRPGMRFPEIGGSFLGVKFGADKAKPFWGWHDMATLRKKILNTGQWATDPAYAVSKNLTFPSDRPVSLNYVYNPYLDVGTPTASTTAPPSPIPSAPAVSASGSCEFDLSVDGAAAIVLAAGNPVIETLSGAPVEERRVKCDGAPGDGARFEVEKREGRGKVRLVGPGRVEVDDPARGAALYRIVVKWR
jgi:hypothetical protein